MKSIKATPLWAACASIVASVGGGLPSLASAALLDGKQITTAFYYPDQQTIGFGGVPIVSTVGPGIEIAASPQGFPITSIDFADTSISFVFNQDLVGTVAAFNGWRFYDASDTIPSFTSATLTTTLPGWSVSFDAQDIWLNGSGAQYFTGSTLRIDFAAVPAVPEPATISLVSLGLAAAASMRWHRRPRA